MLKSHLQWSVIRRRLKLRLVQTEAWCKLKKPEEIELSIGPTRIRCHQQMILTWPVERLLFKR